MKQVNLFKTGLAVICMLAGTVAQACEVCNQNQPKILRGITHGGGPQSNWDYFVVIAMVIITVYTLYATIRCFLKPQHEGKYNNIKNAILNQQ
ncbi:hypothetical protein [Pelobium manganitolerans]|uniref:hypothetical protein n=1 Tax=Pelobium manganitolerans TaxID=1842495 RepID=UPI003FA3921B